MVVLAPRLLTLMVVQSKVIDVLLNEKGIFKTQKEPVLKYG